MVVAACLMPVGRFWLVAGVITLLPFAAVPRLGIQPTLLDGVLAKRVKTSFLPEEDYGYLFMNVQLPPAASLERTDAVCRKIDEMLSKTDGVQAFNTIEGFSLLTRVSASYNAFYFVELKPWSKRGSGADSEASWFRCVFAP